MSVRARLMTIVLFVALVPISVSAWTSLRIHQRALEQTLASLHQAAASSEARRVDSHLKGVEGNLQRLATHTLPWHELSNDEQQAALWMLYRTDEDITAVMLLDGERHLVAQPAYLTESSATEEPSHLPEPSSIVATLIRHLPMGSIAQRQPSFGQAFLTSGDQSPILPILLPLPTRGTGAAPRSLAIGLSLRTVCKSEHNEKDIELLLIDSEGRSLCKSPGRAPLVHLDEPALQPIRSSSTVHAYRIENGQERLRAAAAMPIGWHVIAEQPTSTAFAASRVMRRQALVWILVSVAIALAAGLLLARSITLPIRKLVAGAQALARGDLDYRFESPDEHEFGQLGDAFNHMAQELGARHGEIRAWNAELQQRVEERTRAIEQYHSHLVQAEKAAVMAKLTAGVAAEVNDPLTGILGAVQFLASRARSDPSRAEEARLFDNAEQGAQRIRELVKRVQALGQRQPRSQLRPIALADVIASVLELSKPLWITRSIDVVLSGDVDDQRVLGNFTQLEQALLQVLENAIASCHAASRLAAENDPAAVLDGANDTDPRGRIGIQVTHADSAFVEVAVSDDGVGIPTHAVESIFEPFVTLRPESGRGLGLAIAKRIIEEHDGRLWAEVNATRGVTLRMRLPVADIRAA